jgi:lipoprotein-anchoring transpeptidase ErfK/SrfK
MKKFLPTVRALAVACGLLTAAACVNETSKTGNTTPGANASGANTAAAEPSPASSSKKAEAAASSPVTLPVLDALFADEAFAGELKSKLQLTDEQIAQLRKVAREETAGLEEKEGDDHAGTTTEATARAAERIRAAVGAEKSEQLMAFVGERWSGGGGGDANTSASSASKPNGVPSDTRVVVNIPAYRMDAYENGRLVKSYKIGIGYPEFPLPTGTRKASEIIFNPTWTPPDEPWVKGQFKPGQKVEAGSKLNPLGVIKIPIGAPSLIHGGKSPARLGSFASHGCVGLTNQQVQEFSVLLAQLGGAQVSKEQVDAYAKKRDETKNVKLSNGVPVELRYETIVVSDGRLHIYRDVYDRGTNTEENLRRVLEGHGVSLDQLSEEERTRALEAVTQMARDASGKPATGAGATPSPTPGKKSAPGNNSNSAVRETKTIKGQKEIVIEVAALKGKGYPEPTPGSGFDAPKQSPAPKGAQPKRQGARA